MKNVKAKFAAAVTVVALGGFTGLALSQGGAPPSKAVADKPAIRTKVIRRTIHVTKHAKPKHPVGAAPVVPGASAGASGSAVVTGSSGGGAETIPVSTGSSGGGSGESAPVTTSSSGSGGGGDDEYEDVGDDHGGEYESDDDHGGHGESGDDGGGHEGGDD